MSETQYQLTVRKGPTVGEVFLLDLPIITIGRDPIADIVINDPEISRQHTRFTRTPKGFSIQDLGSTNGTFVNGERISGDPIDLQPDQTVSMGSGVTLLYELIEIDSENLGILEVEPDPSDAFFYVPAEEPEEEIIEDVPYSYSEPVYAPSVAPPPEVIGTADYEDNRPNNNQRNIIIATTAFLLLCCCCSFFTFMYFYGGDWLLQQMGLIP